MVCFQNSRNWSSTAREEPAVRRINDVNPRNGSATSLANSQSSPSLPIPPVLPYSPGTPLPSLSRRSRACPLLSPLEPPSLFYSGPTPTRPEEPQARPGRWTFALSCRLYARFVVHRFHVLTTPPSYRPYWSSSSSPLPLSSHASSSASTAVVSSPGILPTEFRNNRLARRRSSRPRQNGT